MTENTSLAIALICAAAVLAFGYIRALRHPKTAKERLIEKAEKKGNYTIAHCVKSVRRLGDRNSGSDDTRYDAMVVTYEYVVDGVTYRKKIKYYEPGNVSIHYPTSITVYYKAGNPGKGVCREEAKRNTSAGCSLWFVLAIAVCAVVFNLLKSL